MHSLMIYFFRNPLRFWLGDSKLPTLVRDAMEDKLKGHDAWIMWGRMGNDKNHHEMAYPPDYTRSGDPISETFNVLHTMLYFKM